MSGDLLPHFQQERHPPPPGPTAGAISTTNIDSAQYSSLQVQPFYLPHYRTGVFLLFFHKEDFIENQQKNNANSNYLQSSVVLTTMKHVILSYFHLFSAIFTSICYVSYSRTSMTSYNNTCLGVRNDFTCHRYSKQL